MQGDLGCKKKVTSFLFRRGARWAFILILSSERSCIMYPIFPWKISVGNLICLPFSRLRLHVCDLFSGNLHFVPVRWVDARDWLTRLSFYLYIFFTRRPSVELSEWLNWLIDKSMLLRFWFRFFLLSSLSRSYYFPFVISFPLMDRRFKNKTKHN